MNSIRKSFLILIVATASAHAQWQPLFDGETLNGWTSNEEIPDCFSVEDGAIKIQGGRAHLFYSGEVATAQFKNFELQVYQYVLGRVLGPFVWDSY